MNLSQLRADSLQALPDEALRDYVLQALRITEEDRKQNQILFYQPASPKAQIVHDCKAKTIGIGGGNGSSKSETALVEMVMCATGMFPVSQRHLIAQKFRGPIACRLVVESLTTTLEPIILPKLMHWRWTGVDAQGGARGHWGWIPKQSLIDGEWDRSWSAKLRMLRLICRDPQDTDRILGESTIQCMSVDQDPTDFASGDFHFVLHDEPPSLAIWRENEARTMRVDGRMILAMTWPDDPSINVDWLYNEVYEPGRSGNDPQIAWFELWTTENKNLKQEAVAAQAAKWSNEISGVRIYGRPIRFSNRIHPEFTDNTKTWCFRCDKSIIPVPAELTVAGIEPALVCPECASANIVEFNHVQEFEVGHAWPTVFLLDPHPRKPHAFMWVQITPSDDWQVIADGECEGDCTDVRKQCDDTEREFGLSVAQRIMDPNMGASPSGQKRELTWQSEFADAGLSCELADDSGVGRARVNTMLKPDPHTLHPRLIIHPRCKRVLYQLPRFVWDNFSTRVDKDVKQTPKAKYDDYPALLRYLANSEPQFRFLKDGAPIINTRRGMIYGQERRHRA